MNMIIVFASVYSCSEKARTNSTDKITFLICPRLTYVYYPLLLKYLLK